MVCAHKVAPFDQHRLPLAGGFGVQTMLMDVGWHNRLCLYVEEIFSAVRLELNGEVRVNRHVPKRLAEYGEASIERPETSISCPLNVWLVLRQLSRYIPMKADM